tara:strand:- start:2027 stop:3163 length:1137 start_codon:yes stop_codon:yes gene_type:complete
VSITKCPLPQLLLAGLDSLYVSYYLDLETSDLDFADLEFRKLMLADRETGYDDVTLGSERFLLKPYGKKPYKYVLANDAFQIALAERLKPSASVQFMSKALWHEGADALHARILAWAESLNAHMYKMESISRADWAFDFHLPSVDFAEDHFASRARKDNTWRDAGRVQTFQFGTGDTVVRVYDKVAEIEQASSKIWFHDIWARPLADLGIGDRPTGTDGINVWRVEFQVRRDRLRDGGIITYTDLTELAGDLLRDLAYRHTTLRCPIGDDSNKARWPLHPLWDALQTAIEDMPAQGLLRAYRDKNPLDYRLNKLSKALYGYTKGVGALLRLLQSDQDAPIELEEVLAKLPVLINEHHVPSLWREEVEQRVRAHGLGQW